jgi:hypothetical protein
MGEAPIPDNSEAATAPQADQGVNAKSPSPDEALRQLRDLVSSLLQKSEGASLSELSASVQTASNALRVEYDLRKLQAEMNKLEEEAKKLAYENATSLRRERSERFKEYAAVLTPLVTIIVLAGTLIAQNWQFLRSEKDKRDDALDARWQDTVKAISQSGTLSPSVIALQPFLSTPKYSEQAREMAMHVLANSADSSFFDSLFGPAFLPLDHSNINRLIRLDRALGARGSSIWTRSWVEQTQTSNLSLLSPDELKTYYYVEKAVPSISTQIAQFLKARHGDSPPLDLSGTYFEQSDWRGVDLSGCDIDNLRLETTDLKDANLSNIQHFSTFFPLRTAWWEADKISAPLLAYLDKYYKVDPRVLYGTKAQSMTLAEYQAAVARLEKGSR